MTQLPDKLSDLIDVALADLEKVEKDPRYKVYMASWHTPFEGVCHVCLGGAVIAGALGHTPSEYVTPYDTRLSKHTVDRILALNVLRDGSVYQALCHLQYESLDISTVPERLTVRYEDDPVEFKKQLRDIAAALRAMGL